MNDSDKPQTEAQAVQIRGRLQLACAQDSPVSLLAAHMSLSCVGRFHAVTADGVVLDIPNPPEGTLEGAVAVVSYSVGQATMSFQSDVLSSETLEDVDGSLRVTLALPSVLQRENRRAAVRVPVPRGSTDAAIIRGSARGPVRVVDSSLLGMLVELEASDGPAVGETVVLRLVVGTIQAVLEAEVRRRDGRRLGLRFVTDGGPPKAMSKIMWRIQEERRRTSKCS